MGKKLFFALLKGISVSGIIGVALLSESVISTPKPSETGFLHSRSNDQKPGFLSDQNTIIAQNSSNSEADRLYQEGLQLFRQRTAESLRAALEKLEAARQLYRAARDKGNEAVTLLGMGRINDDLGEKQKALDYYNQALPLYRAVGDRGGEAATLNNIGLVYDSLGEKQKALDYYNQALPLLRAVGDRGGEATTLNNIGSVYNSLGEKQKALDYYNQALPLYRAVGDRGGEATTLNNIGGAYNSLGEKQKALDYYNQALPLRRAVEDRGGEAVTLNNIGNVYDSLGEKQQALDYYNQALPLLRAVGDRGGEAATLNNIGGAYNSLGEKQKALDYYNQALPLLRAVGYRGGEATTLSNFAFVKRTQGNLTEALTDIEAAITIVEDLRTKIGSQDLRQSYFATVQDYYKFYIDLLMQLHQQNPNKGYDAQALHISERARARSLLELLTEATANIRSGADPKLLEQERNLQQQLNTFEHRRYQLQSGQFDEQELNEIKQKIDNVLAQLKQLEAQIRTTSPRYAALKYPEPLNLQQIQQQILDDDTLLLQYSLGAERSYLWAVTKNSITSYVLPKQSEIEAAVKTFRESVTKDSSATLDTGLSLSQILLAPVANLLSNKRLLIVGDGALQYVPFAALPIPGNNKMSVSHSYAREINDSEGFSFLLSTRPEINFRRSQAEPWSRGESPLKRTNSPVFTVGFNRLKLLAW
ncbi:CHAT domain-containing protein, partial [Microseira wollei]|uniref:CHAT domain-containing protein n=1 Tax=Microseira wollei TaxID=467598 RepID=UPI001CFE9D9F